MCSYVQFSSTRGKNETKFHICSMVITLFILVQKFMAAISERFSMIDVVKHQKEANKKGGKKLLTLTNEVKIITFPDNLWNLWKEVITCAAQGDLIDPDSQNGDKFKDKEGFVPDKDLTLSREFFKFLGNLSETDHEKLCKHILHRSGPSRDLRYPKVVLKQPKSVKEDCYAIKDYIERRKRKAIAQLQLHKINPELGIFKNDVFDSVAWKKFKNDFHVTKASMRVLLEWGVPELYYANQKATMHRNTRCEDISPFAKQFFRVFLEVRSNFNPSYAPVHLRTFERKPPMTLAPWGPDTWDIEGEDANLGIIDFRLIPGTGGKAKSSIEKPFFEQFMKYFANQKEPSLSSLPCWLFICGNGDDYLQVEAFARNTEYFGSSSYELVQSTYIPAANERLGGYSAKSKEALEPVRLLFLIKQSVRLAARPSEIYLAPEHMLYEKPRKYNEVEYSMFANELRMEFYLQVIRLFCGKRESIFLLYTGTKAIVASVVSSTSV